MFTMKEREMAGEGRIFSDIQRLGVFEAPWHWICDHFFTQLHGSQVCLASIADDVRFVDPQFIGSPWKEGDS